VPAVDEKLQIVYAPVNELRPYKGNPRKISEKGLQKLQRSVEEFGFVNPILVQRGTNMIIAGHQRLKAAQAAGLSEVPVVWLDMDDVTAKAYNIADNRLQDEAEWDFTPLADLLTELDTGAFDLTLTGFDTDELERMMNYTPVGEVQEDEAPEPPAEAVTKPGDIWQLGKHRVMCGDSTKAEDVERLMAGVCASAVVTDPPYGQNQEGVTGDAPDNLAHIVKAASILPVKDAAVVAFQSPRTFVVWLQECLRAGHKLERMLWLYKQAQNSYPWRGWLLTSEAILVTSVGSPHWNDAHPYSHDCYLLSEVSNELPEGIGWHGSVKPLSVVLDIVTRVSFSGDVVYDPFLGSGTTLIAAEQLRRTCYGMEIDPRYCDVTVKRWEQLTGKKAELVR